MASVYRRRGSPYYWIAYRVDGRRVQRSLKTTDPVQADRARRSVESSEWVEGARGARGSHFRNLANHWLAVHRGAWADSTAQNARCQVDAFARWRGDDTAGEVSPREIRQYVSLLRARGLRPVSINNWLQTMQTMYAWALRSGLALTNPVADCPREREDEHVIQVLSETDRDRLIQHLPDAPGPLRASIVLALFCGLRAGEIRRLLWRDVDAERRRVLVRRTKTRKYRYVPLPTVALALLADARGKGHVYNVGKKQLHRALQRFLKPLGIEAHWYILRHTYASTLARAGVSLYKIAAWLGTKTLAVVQRNYARLAEDYDSDVEVFNVRQAGADSFSPRTETRPGADRRRRR